MRLFFNAVVHVFDPALPVPRTVSDLAPANALLVGDDGKVLATGDVEDLRARAAELSAPAEASGASATNPGVSALEEIDLGGRVVVPGLVDAHLHVLSYAESLAEVDLRGTATLEEAIAVLRAYAADLPDGMWLTGGRWDFNKWGLAQQPDRELLDAAFPDRPVALSSIDFHTLWCNGAALRAAGVDASTADPAGGAIVRDAHGEATGILRETAADLVWAVVPDLPLEVRVEYLRRAQQEWLAEGLTSVHDIDGAASREAWEELRARGEQRMRVVKYLRPEELAWAVEAGWHTGGGDAWFTRGGLKLFSDGALGSQSSHMSKAYPHAHDEPENYGIQITTEDQLVEQITEALAHGIAPAIHAIGDQANHHVLNAYARTAELAEAARARTGLPLRGRIEHAQFVQPGDVDRFRELGIIASMQPRHCISDLHLIERLRPDEALAAYAWTDLEDSGAVVAFGSDGPVEPSNPFAAIYAAMTRADISGDPATSYQCERRMSAYRAWRAHSWAPAFAAGIEERAGHLGAGADADFLVLDIDPFTFRDDSGAVVGDGVSGEYASEEALFAHAEALRDAAPVLTVVAGEVAYEREVAPAAV